MNEQLINLLATPAGQAVLLALAGAVTTVAAVGGAWLGKRLGVTPAQVREVVETGEKAGALVKHTLSDPQVKEITSKVNRAIKDKLLGR